MIVLKGVFGVQEISCLILSKITKNKIYRQAVGMFLDLKPH